MWQALIGPVTELVRRAFIKRQRRQRSKARRMSALATMAEFRTTRHGENKMARCVRGELMVEAAHESLLDY